MVVAGLEGSGQGGERDGAGHWWGRGAHPGMTQSSGPRPPRGTGGRCRVWKQQRSPGGGVASRGRQQHVERSAHLGSCSPGGPGRLSGPAWAVGGSELWWEWARVLAAKVL